MSLRLDWDGSGWRWRRSVSPMRPGSAGWDGVTSEMWRGGVSWTMSRQAGGPASGGPEDAALRKAAEDTIMEWAAALVAMDGRGFDGGEEE